jgi:beta-N-acetylhexosaminidase
MPLACIIDVAGPRLTPDEKAFFRAADPWAFILFARSCQSPEQMRALTGEMRDAVGREALIFIDQEGGRVQRLKPPVWPQFPPVALYGRIWQRDPDAAIEACFLHHRLIAHELRAVGVDADCAPCLDLLVEGASSVIGDRAFSTDPDVIARLGRAAMDGLHAGGVASVIKHMPGHGRATLDSHHALPVVDAGRQALAHDFAPFRALKDARMAMSAHIVFEAFDETAPATLSREVVTRLIREDIGFDGLLMTDDVSMKALSGSVQDKAAGSLLAGCDVAMLCNASLEERLAFAAACPSLSGRALERALAAEAVARVPLAPFDAGAAVKRFNALTGQGVPVVLAIDPDPTEQRALA